MGAKFPPFCKPFPAHGIRDAKELENIAYLKAVVIHRAKLLVDASDKNSKRWNREMIKR
jgi:hypothetical protein